MIILKVLANNEGTPFLNVISVTEIIIILASLIILFVLSQVNFLLFHGLAELFSIAIASSAFLISLYGKDNEEYNYLKFIGASYFIIAIIDLIHTLAYKGMGVFTGYDANLPTQLWIMARYLQAIALFIASLMIDRKFRSQTVAILYSIIGLFLLGTVFIWDVFPACFIEGQGLTQFKIYSEYLISAIILFSIIPLRRKRKKFSSTVYSLIILSILFTVFSELAFTFYVSVFGISNVFGHFFKIIEFYMIYKAIIYSGIEVPYNENVYLNQILQSIRKINQLIVWENDEDDLLRKSCETLTETKGYHYASITLFDQDGQPTDFYSSKNSNTDNKVMARITESTPDCLSKALDQNELFICSEPTEDCKDCPWSQFLPNITTASLRLRYQNKVYGVLTVSYPSSFDHEHEKGLLEEVADDIAFSLNSMEIEKARIERVKELTCLYEINSLALEFPDSLDFFLTDTIPIIQRAYRFPEITEVRITVNGDVYESINFQESSWSQTAVIIDDSAKVGSIEVYYIKPVRKDFEGPFSEEERELIDGIAHRISQYITQMKISNALREEETKYRSLIENSRDAAFVVVGTQIVYVNKEAANLLNVNYPNVLLGKDIMEFTHPDSRELIRQRAFQRQSGLDIPDRYSANIQTSDGFQKTVEFNVSQVQWEGKSASLAFTRDQSDRIRSEERLSALHNHARELALVETVEEVVDISLKIIKEVIGCEFYTFAIRIDDFLRPIRALGRVLLDITIPINGKGISARAARENRTIYAKDVRKNQDYIESSMKSLSEIAVPVAIGEEVVAVIILEGMQVDSFSEGDISLAEILSEHIATTFERIRATVERQSLQDMVIEERIKAQQAEEMERLKTNFISTATHEIRTPLTAIIGFLDLITSENSQDLPAEVKEDLEIVHRNASRLVKLTNDLLDTQRITSGRLEVEFEPFDLVPLLNEVVKEITPLFDVKKQGLEIKSPESLEISADRVRIGQVLVNLLGNANKFTHEGEHISVSVTSSDEKVEIAVTDTGIGLSEEDLEKLFSPFPGIRHNQNVSSTGLGLAISKGIIELHGGEIFAESDGPGEGTTFTVIIPPER